MISIVMPTYNRETYLAEAIESVLKQSYKDFELIVVNDGSTDSTELIMEYFIKKDKRIRYFDLGKNFGIAHARNYGISKSTGEYIAVMDSDDLMSPDRLKRSLKILKHDFVYTSYYLADEHAQIKQIYYPPKTVTKKEVHDNAAWPHVTIIARRKCFEENPYREELKVNDDMGLCVDWFKAGYKGNRVLEPMMIVRTHPQSTSSEKQKQVNEITKKLQEELDGDNAV
jgi:glycosyltransferase involved in cell wall biosynthesis